jgi:hypothetical protein
MVRFLAILVLCSPLFAQTFQIVPSMAPRGGTGSLLITFVSPAGKEPVALQWKIALGTEVTAAGGDLVAGEVAGAAGKALACAPAKAAGQESAIFNCILSGGKKTIPNGTIFLVKYRVKPQATPSTLAVRVSDGIAVSEEANQLRKTPLSPVEGTITIR